MQPVPASGVMQGAVQHGPFGASMCTGFITLQPNGRKAAAAISPALGVALERNAIHEKRTLLHGEDGECVPQVHSHLRPIFVHTAVSEFTPLVRLSHLSIPFR